MFTLPISPLGAELTIIETAKGDYGVLSDIVFPRLESS